MALTTGPTATDIPLNQSELLTILVMDDTLDNLFVFQQVIEHSFKSHQILMTTDPLEGLNLIK